MKINTITKISSKKNYYILHINNKQYPIDYYFYECLLPYVGKQLEVSQMLDVIAFSSAYNILNKLYSKIFNHQLSTYEVKAKLKNKEVSDEHISLIITYLKNEGHLKEIDFINHYKEIYQNQKGVNAFKRFLKSKYISDKSIEIALYDFNEDEQLAYRLATAYIKNKVGSNKALKMKTLAFLLNKGFSNKLSNKIVEQLVFDNEFESLIKECNKYYKKYPNDFNKIISKLAIKGYNVSDIKNVLKKVGMSNED